MKITKKHILSFSLLSLFFFIQVFLFMPLSAPAQADTSFLGQQTGIDEIKQVYGNPTDGETDIRYIVARVVTLVVGFVATVFLILLLIAGYRYMMSSGNEEKVRTATGQIKTAIIGLAITMGAWAISRFVLLRISAAVENRVDMYYPM